LTGTSPEANGKEEVGLEIVAEPETVTNLEVELPLEGYQGQSLRNLMHVIYSRQPLIKKSLGLKPIWWIVKPSPALTQKPMVTVGAFSKRHWMDIIALASILILKRKPSPLNWARWR